MERETTIALRWTLTRRNDGNVSDGSNSNNGSNDSSNDNNGSNGSSEWMKANLIGFEAKTEFEKQKKWKKWPPTEKDKKETAMITVLNEKALQAVLWIATCSIQLVQPSCFKTAQASYQIKLKLSKELSRSFDIPIPFPVLVWRLRCRFVKNVICKQQRREVTF